MIQVTRRTVLSAIGGGIAVAVSGCTGPIASISGENPDDAAKHLTARSESELIASYDAVIAAIPSLSQELSPIRDQHKQHLSALGESPATAVSPAAIETASRDTALKALRMLEKQAASRRTMAALTVGAGDLVSLLARIGASEAGHAAFLSGVH